jgi:hypothetical protein
MRRMNLLILKCLISNIKIKIRFKKINNLAKHIIKEKYRQLKNLSLKQNIQMILNENLKAQIIQEVHK